jgi:glycosyltransferase involved in cell wall biosynthesis
MAPAQVAAIDRSLANMPWRADVPTRPQRHIALLMASFNGRGVQRVFLNLGAELVGRGHRVTLLVCRCSGSLEGESLGGMRLVPLGPVVPTDWRLVRALAPLLRHCIGASGTPYLSRLAGLLEFVENERPDVVLSGGTRCNVLNGMARRLSSVAFRAVLTEHNPLSGKLRRASRQWKLRGVTKFYPHGDAIAGVSKGVADELALYLGRDDRLPVLPNPVITPLFRKQSAEAPPHPWLTDGGPPVVLAVGALEPRKNFAMLLRAVARLRQRLPVRLIVLGEGPQRAELETLAGELGIIDAVAMPGFTRNVAAWLASASALALSSTYEGFGCVIVEALACGCPVVSTDCPYGPREILADGRYGRLVEPNDYHGLAVALEETLAERTDHRALVERARQYTVARAADAYLALMFRDQSNRPGEPLRAESKISS